MEGRQREGWEEGLPLRGLRVALRPKRTSDAVADYAWRRDPELCRLDAASPLVVSFPDYLASHAEDLSYPSPSRVRFAIDVDGKHIGNCMFFDIDPVQGQAEMGIMIGDRRYWDQGYGADAITTLLEYGFTQMGLRRIYLYTLDWNIRAQRCFRKCGFSVSGRLRREGSTFIVMDVLREQWQPRVRARPASPGDE